MSEADFRASMVAIRDDARLRIGALNHLIESIEALYALPPLGVPTRNEAPAPPPKGKAPRPQRPASPATNGTGRAHKVKGKRGGELSPTAATILAAVTKAPMAPIAIAQQLKMERSLLGYHLKNLSKAGLVTMSGTTSTRRVSLP